MKLLDIINSITGGKATKRTSAELRASLAEIDLAALERAVTDIERQRRALLLTGSDAELLAITQDLTAANLEAERAQALTDELKKLIAEAEAREAQAAVEQRAAEGRAARDRLIGHYTKADELAAELANTLQKIGQDRHLVQDANRTTSAKGRPDLRVNDPIGDIAGHLGYASADRIPNPLHWTLKGYWPLTDGSGISLARDRSLGRARELLDETPTRKAA